jgi:predicted nucleotidyltransferase
MESLLKRLNLLEEIGKLPINTIVETLENEERVLFAYLYGSVAAGEKPSVPVKVRHLRLEKLV